MGQLIKVAEANEVPPGTAKAVEADGRRIALFNHGVAITPSTTCVRTEEDPFQKVR